MSKVVGEVQYVNAKQFNGKTLYSIKVNDTYYGTGNKNPNCAKGDQVEFDAEQKGQYLNVVGNVRITSGAAPAQTTGVTQSSGGGSSFEKTKQNAIALQSARNTAISAVGLLLNANAVKLPTAQNKVADVILALVDDLAIRYYDEVQVIYSGGKPGDKPVEAAVGFSDLEDEDEDA